MDFLKRNWGVLAFGLCLVMAAGAWTFVTKTEPSTQSGKLKGQTAVFSEEENPSPVIDSELFVSPSELIEKGHQFYNATAGWGRIDALNWQDQRAFARLLLTSLEHLEEKEALVEDFTHIQSIAAFIVENNREKEHIRLLHRIFHDLDIDVNRYEHEDYFGVTFYGEGEKTKEVVKHIEENSDV